MFNNKVASVAKGNQVLEAVGLFVVGEISETANMMHVHFPAKFIFRDATPLAFVAVALTGCAALWSPVGAIVGKITATPVEVILARFLRSLKHSGTLSGAGDASQQVALFGRELFATNGATLGDGGRQVGGATVLLAKLGIVGASGRMLFHPTSEARKRTETPAGRFGGGCVLLAALFARRLERRWLPAMNVGGGVFTRTFFGAVLARPRLVIGKLFAALRALSGNCLFAGVDSPRHKKSPVGIDRQLVEGAPIPTRDNANNNRGYSAGQVMRLRQAELYHITCVLASRVSSIRRITQWPK